MRISEKLHKKGVKVLLRLKVAEGLITRIEQIVRFFVDRGVEFVEVQNYEEITGGVVEFLLQSREDEILREMRK